jgi:hypothetical protein
MHHLPPRIASLCGTFLLLGATGCVDSARIDALDQNLARVRAESAQRDAQIQWLRWGQMVLSTQFQAEREATARRVASLEAQNAALLQRLQRAEQKLGLERAADPGPAPARVFEFVRRVDAQAPPPTPPATPRRLGP